MTIIYKCYNLLLDFGFLRVYGKSKGAKVHVKTTPDIVPSALFFPINEIGSVLQSKTILCIFRGINALRYFQSKGTIYHYAMVTLLQKKITCDIKYRYREISAIKCTKQFVQFIILLRLLVVLLFKRSRNKNYINDQSITDLPFITIEILSHGASFAFTSQEM